jgi:hypothetical protein
MMVPLSPDQLVKEQRRAGRGQHDAAEPFRQGCASCPVCVDMGEHIPARYASRTASSSSDCPVRTFEQGGHACPIRNELFL